ncbi:MAG: hypothetical protein KDE51_07990 [Anaerolineales bacterium]|nr:hypothetical protein [Anaerolineales bacterium]
MKNRWGQKTKRLYYVCDKTVNNTTTIYTRSSISISPLYLYLSSLPKITHSTLSRYNSPNMLYPTPLTH